MSITTSEAVSILRPLKLFSSMSDQQLEQLFRLASYNEAKPDEYMLAQEEEGNEIFVILSGLVEVEVNLPNGTGREVIAKLGPGDVLGELCLVGLERRSASARVVGKVSYLHWQKEDLVRLFKENKEIGYEFMNRMAEILAQRLVHTNQDLSFVFYQVFYAK